MKFKHSIGQLVLAIVGFGLIFRAVTAPSAIWGAVILSLALSICTLAAVGGLCARGPRRASYGGAAICGWAYLLVSLGPWAKEQIGPHLVTSAVIDLFSATVRGPAPTDEKLVTLLNTRDELRLTMKKVNRASGNSVQSKAMMQRLEDEYQSIQAAVEKYGVQEDEAGGQDRWVAWTRPDLFLPTGADVSASPNFQRIGHSLFAIAFAFVGGAFGRFVARADPEAP